MDNRILTTYLVSVAVIICVSLLLLFLGLLIWAHKSDIKSKINKRKEQQDAFDSLPKKFIKDYEFYSIYLTEENIWCYRYYITDVFDRANRKKFQYRLSNSNHVWDLAMSFNEMVEKSMLDCKIEHLLQTAKSRIPNVPKQQRAKTN